MHNFVFWRRVFVDVYWWLHTFALSRCTCYVFIFLGAAYNINLCNSAGSHMRDCNIFSYCEVLVHHSLGNCIQYGAGKLYCYYVIWLGCTLQFKGSPKVGKIPSSHYSIYVSSDVPMSPRSR